MFSKVEEDLFSDEPTALVAGDSNVIRIQRIGYDADRTAIRCLPISGKGTITFHIKINVNIEV